VRLFRRNPFPSQSRMLLAELDAEVNAFECLCGSRAWGKLLYKRVVNETGAATLTAPGGG